MDVNTWPDVPSDKRPRVLYHALPLDEAATSILKSKGWMPTDVRLLPAETDAERTLRVRAYLEGLMFGTIELLNNKMFDILELEAKSCGDIGNKTPQGDPKMGLKADDARTLLDLTSPRAFAGQQDDQAALTKMAKRGGSKET